MYMRCFDRKLTGVTQRIFQGPNYKCLTRETRHGDLHPFFHTDSENQFFKKFYHSVKKFVGHMAPPSGQIFLFWTWAKFSQTAKFGPSFSPRVKFYPSFAFL